MIRRMTAAIARAVTLTVEAVLVFAAVRLLDRLPAPSTASPSRSAGLLRRCAPVLAVLLAIAMVGGGLVMLSGVVPIKASSGHWAITASVLQFAKRRSVATHTIGTSPPPLHDRGLAVKGASHYDLGCRPCHGSPALEQPRIAAAMTPRPPDLREVRYRWDPEELFYIVRHGIKFTGMPAWPANGRDDEVWAVVAFLLTMPSLDRAAYEELALGSFARSDADEPIADLVVPRGARSSTLVTCARCHGVDGLGRAYGAFPRLAGQRPLYLAASLRAYANGQRRSGIMGPLAAGLSAEETEALSDYYASLDARPTMDNAKHERADVERGEEIATRGVPERIVPACAKCHGPGAPPRNPIYPRLAGQYADYLALQLRLFRSDHRGGTAYRGIMKKVAGNLTDDDIRAVSAYYASIDTARGK